jgi:hypothetical protein
MSTFTTTTPHATPAGRVGLAGALGTGAALLGAVHAVLLIAYSPTVGEASYSYPFRPGGFAASQAVLTARDLALAALVAGLLWTPIAHSRVARAGFVSSAVSMLALAGLEVVSVAVRASADPGAWYGLASFGVGLGLAVAGIPAARTPMVSSWLRLLPLAIGLYVFVVLTPGILASFAPGQLVIGAWMLLFARLGWPLLQTPTSTARGSNPPPGAQR